MVCPGSSVDARSQRHVLTRVLDCLHRRWDIEGQSACLYRPETLGAPASSASSKEQTSTAATTPSLRVLADD